jgi:integrase
MSTPWEYGDIMRERLWLPTLKQAQVKYRSPYNCRYTYASIMLTTGNASTWLAKQMGHKDWGMIRMLYARWIDS